MAKQAQPRASIVIATRNRRDDTLVAIASALGQDVPVEILVYDDASTDGTAAALPAADSRVRVFRNTERSGYIVNRNRGFRDAAAPIVFSLDDDAYFSHPSIVSNALRVFERDPSIAAVAIPYIEPLNRRSLSSLRSGPPPAPGSQLRSYVGCAHAIRTQAALSVGGYREFFVHQREEPDLCLRLLNNGWRVVYGDGAPIVHMVSPKRDAQRVSFHAARNQVLTDVLNVPLPHLLSRLVRTPLSVLAYRFSISEVPGRLAALSAGWVEAIARIDQRAPVRAASYKAFRGLPSHGALPWQGAIPPPCGHPFQPAAPRVGE